MLALPDDAVASLPSRAFADLVIGLQQQRAQEAIVREAVPPKLLEMVSAGFEYAPALAKVQQRLLEDFDVSRLRGELSAERAWQLTTEHIDKLEKLQALLSYEWAKKDGAHADANAARTDRESPGAQDPPTASESAAKSNVPLNAATALNHVPRGNVLPFTNSKRGTNLTLR